MGKLYNLKYLFTDCQATKLYTHDRPDVKSTYYHKKTGYRPFAQGKEWVQKTDTITYTRSLKTLLRMIVYFDFILKKKIKIC